jgi:Tfp pilus assembly protein PilV
MVSRATQHPGRRWGGGVRARRRCGVVLVDVVVGVVLLGLALSAILGIAGRALASQSRGEQLQTAAMLLDEQLGLVLMRGPDNYASAFGTDGRCDPPFDGYAYHLDISGGDASSAYLVRATVSWPSGGRLASETVETLIAPRRGDDPNPDRRPSNPVTRY